MHAQVRDRVARRRGEVELEQHEDREWNEHREQQQRRAAARRDRVDERDEREDRQRDRLLPLLNRPEEKDLRDLSERRPIRVVIRVDVVHPLALDAHGFEVVLHSARLDCGAGVASARNRAADENCQQDRDERAASDLVVRREQGGHDADQQIRRTDAGGDAEHRRAEEVHDLGGGDEERIAGRVRVIGGDVEVAHAEGEETLVPIKHRVREREEPRERDDDGQDEENVLLRARQTAPFSQIWPGDGRHGRQRRLARPSWDVVANGMISAENSRKGVRRRWYLDLHGIRREGTKESGFSYRLPNGSIVSDDKVLARIRKLRIPPAWRDVRIARGDAAPLQAAGVDKKGRTEYLYHSRFRAQREEAKFKRVVEFGESLPALRRRVRADLNRGKHASRRD